MMTLRKRGIWWALVPVLAALQSFAGYAVAVAQSTKVSIDIYAKSDSGAMWYSTWWFWVLVGLFVIVVIVAITSRGRPVRE